MSLSKTVISGKVIRSPEKRFTPSNNVAVTEFAIQVESIRRGDGPAQTNVVKVVTWRELAERCAHEISKGDLVAVDGRLQINNYTTADGQRRREVEIDAVAVENLTTIFAGSPPKGPTAEEGAVAEVGAATGGRGGQELESLFANEDEIPF